MDSRPQHGLNGSLQGKGQMKTYFCEHSGRERPPLIKELRRAEEAAAAALPKHVKTKSPALSGGKSVLNSPALSGRSEASFVESVFEGAAKICGTERSGAERVCF